MGAPPEDLHGVQCCAPSLCTILKNVQGPRNKRAKTLLNTLPAEPTGEQECSIHLLRIKGISRRETGEVTLAESAFRPSVAVPRAKACGVDCPISPTFMKGKHNRNETRQDPPPAQIVASVQSLEWAGPAWKLTLSVSLQSTPTG